MPITDVLNPAGLAGELAEDLATRWVPDVIGDADVIEQLARPSVKQGDVLFVDVPKVGGGYRQAPMLSGSALSALRLAVEPALSLSDEVLDPAVCGYRRGASGSASYSEEYRRFRDFSWAMSEQCTVVVIADVRDFFRCVNGESLRRSLRFFDASTVQPISDVMRELARQGVEGLPAGYGDARLVANLVLSAVDEKIRVPFTRWVDDYRLFASSHDEASAAVKELRSALSHVGLQLNQSKLQVLDSMHYRSRRHGVPLDSVYHPQDEPSSEVRANLRSVFLRAVSEGNRRQLRFALPRLAKQSDDIAIPYAIQALSLNSVDAPRLVHYLSAFLGDQATVARIEALVQADSIHDWALARLVPVLTRVPLTDETVRALDARLASTQSPLVWGLLLRVLARRQAGTSVLRSVANCKIVPDDRAVIAALWDIGTPVSAELRRRASATVETLRNLGEAPLPKADTLL